MRFRLGVVAMGVSFIPYLALGLVPFVGVSLAGAAGMVAAVLIAAEVIFWSGLMLAGADARSAIRTHGWTSAPRILWRMLLAGRVRDIPRPTQASETRSA